MDEQTAALFQLLERAVRGSVFDGSYCVDCGQGDCHLETAYSPTGHDEGCWVRDAAAVLGLWDSPPTDGQGDAE